VVVITGATSGLGHSCALQLARRGLKVVIVGRNPVKAAAALQQLNKAAPGADHAAHIADLTLMNATASVAREILEQHPRIDRLINNVGAVFRHRQLSREGLELTFALNHMSYFVLTCGLLPALRAADDAHILSVGSNAHRLARLDWDNLQGERRYVGYGASRQNAYSRSKLCNLLFTRALAARLGKAVRVNCVHPGIVDSNFGDSLTGMPGLAMRLGKRLLGKPPQAAAAALTALAMDADTGTGGYFEGTRLSQPSRAARDDALAERLWSVSSGLSGVDLPS
jgi:NAD(P)-dependent dehydrogenase (short-subunit alcohol dehydrogenase family)